MSDALGTGGETLFDPDVYRDGVGLPAGGLAPETLSSTGYVVDTLRAAAYHALAAADELRRLGRDPADADP